MREEKKTGHRHRTITLTLSHIIPKRKRHHNVSNDSAEAGVWPLEDVLCATLKVRTPLTF